MNNILNEEAKSFRLIRPRLKNGDWKPFMAKLKKNDNTLYLNLTTDENEIFKGMKNLLGSRGPQRFFMRYYFPKRFVAMSAFIIQPREMVILKDRHKAELLAGNIKGFRGMARNRLVDRRNTILDYTDLLKKLVPSDKKHMVKSKVLEYVQSIWPEIICYILFDNKAHDKRLDIDDDEMNYEAYSLMPEDEREYPLAVPFSDMSDEDWNELAQMIDSEVSTEAFVEKLFSKSKVFALSGPAFGMSKFGFDKFIISVPFEMTKYNVLDIPRLTGKVDLLRQFKLDPTIVYPVSVVKFLYACFSAMNGGTPANDFVAELIKHDVTFHFYSKNGTGFCVNLKETVKDMKFTNMRFLQYLISRLKLICMVNTGLINDTDLDKLEQDYDEKEYKEVTANAVDNKFEINNNLKDDLKTLLKRDDSIGALVDAKINTGASDVVEEVYKNGHRVAPTGEIIDEKASKSLLSTIDGIKAKSRVTKYLSDDPDEPPITIDDKDIDDLLSDNTETEETIVDEELENENEDNALIWAKEEADEEQEDEDEIVVEEEIPVEEEKDSKTDEPEETEYMFADEDEEEVDILASDGGARGRKPEKDKGPKKLDDNPVKAKVDGRTAKRIENLKNKYKSLSIDGVSIEKIIGNSANISIDMSKSTGSSKPVVADPNMMNNNLAAFSKSYVKNNYQSDIINAVRSLSVNKEVPLYMTSVNVNDTSDQFTDKLTYSFTLEDEYKKKHRLQFDVPKLDEEGYMKISGMKAYIKKQIIRKPIVKLSPDSVRITTQLNSYLVNRTGFSLNKGSEVVRRLFTEYFVNNKKDVKIELGNCSEDNKNYLTTIEYDVLSNRFFEVVINQNGKYGNHIVIYFDQKIIRSKIEQHGINTGFKDNKIPDNILPVAINYTTRALYSIDMNKNSSVCSTIINILNSELQDPGLIDYVKTIKVPKKRMYSRTNILDKPVPLIAFLNYSFGWDRIKEYLKDNEIEFSPTRLAKTNKLAVKFYDGYLYYNQYPIAGALLLNGLAELKVEDYAYADINNKGLYVNYTIEKYRSSNIVKGWVTVVESALDFKTLQILEALGLPTDICEVFLYCNELLTDNQCLSESDMDNYRIRGNEIISQCLYSVLNDQYMIFKKRSGKGVSMTIPVNSVMTKIYKTNILDFYDSISPVSELRNSGLATFKGPGGTKVEQAFTPEKRSYDPSFFGIFGMSTPDNSNAGVVKELTVNANITNTLGFVGKTDKKDYSFSDITPIAEAMVPFATRVDDPSRIAFISGQNNHVGGLPDSSLPCVRTGMEKAIKFLCSDNFVMRAKDDCTVNEVDEINKMVYLTYKNGLKDVVDYNDKNLKNSDAFNCATYTCYVKAGNKLKTGDVIAADSRFFKVDPITNELVYTQTRNALVAIMEGSYTEDDADAITQEFADQIHMDFTERKQICIKAMDTIFNYKKIGDYVEQGEWLFTFDNSGTYEEKYDENYKGKTLAEKAQEEEDDIMAMTKQIVKAPISGTITDMKVYWTVDIQDMSMQAAKFVLEYIKRIEKAILKEERFTHKQSAKRKLIEPVNKNNYTGGEPRINGCIIDPEGSIIIEYFISKKNGMGVGDKISLNTSLKSVNSYVIEKGLEPFTESGKKLDGVFSWISQNARMVQSLWYQFIGTILYMKSKRIAKNFLKEIGETVPKNPRDHKAI